MPAPRRSRPPEDRVRSAVSPRGSVAGEAEQMARVVYELVHVGVTAEQRHRALVDADEVQRQQRQEGGCRQPERGTCRRQIDRADPAAELSRDWTQSTPSGDFASPPGCWRRASGLTLQWRDRSGVSPDSVTRLPTASVNRRPCGCQQLRLRAAVAELTRRVLRGVGDRHGLDRRAVGADLGPHVADFGGIEPHCRRSRCRRDYAPRRSAAPSLRCGSRRDSSSCPAARRRTWTSIRHRIGRTRCASERSARTLRRTRAGSPSPEGRWW